MLESNLEQKSHEPRNDREEAAFAYADKDWKVLPLQPRGKTPFKGNGVTHATTDKDQIRSWFSDNPDINIGIATGNGLLVLDADSKEAAEGLSNLGPTLTVRTSKGKHFYFQCDRHFKNSVKTVYEGVDVRSLGGYVVAPPSVHESGVKYQWEDPNTSIAPLPIAIEEKLQAGSLAPTTVNRDGNEMLYDGHRNVGLTKVAGGLVDRCVGAGFSEADACALLQVKNLELCIPPLDCADVETIAQSIYAAEMKKTVDKQMRLLSRADIDNLPQPEFLIEGLLVKNSLAILYGEPGGAKTFLALALAISVAGGGSWFGRAVAPAPVVYVCAEGHNGIGRRIKANELHNGLSASNLYVLGESIQLQKSGEVEAFISMLHKENVRPGFVVFDTLSRCTVGVDENAAKEMNVVVASLERIKREFGATVLVVHHSTKADGKTIRGSSVISGGVDTALALVTNKKNRERVLSMEKQRDADLADPLTFTLQPVSEYNSAVPVLVGKTISPVTLSATEQKALATLVSIGSADCTTWKNTSTLAKGTFYRARIKLIEKGLVTEGEDGKYGPIAQAA
jgi:hypothetical protein